MAVSSAVRTSLRISMIFGSPFMKRLMEDRQSCLSRTDKIVCPPRRKSVSRHRGDGFGLTLRARRAGLGGALGGRGEHHPQRVVAGTALIADAAALQIAKGRRTPVDGFHHLSVIGAAADTDDHVSLISFLRLSLNTDIMPRPFPFVKPVTPLAVEEGR